MTTSRPWALEPAAAAPGARARGMVAAMLRGASSLLARLAQRMQIAEAGPATPEPLLEFYAEAGAPEGALYADGRRVGLLQGVTRL